MQSITALGVFTLLAFGGACSATVAPTVATGNADSASGDGGNSLADGGTATDTGAAVVPICTSTSDCPVSKVACLEAFCDSHQVCNLRPVVDVMSCDDKNECTKGDQCVGGACKGAEVQCDDANECTSDNCLPAKGCDHDNLVKVCNTKDLCQLRACQSGVCTTINDKPCDDNNTCTSDSCSQTAGCQFAIAAGASCDDNDGCTKNDACKFGKCKGVGKSCDDGNPCTEDGCDAKSNCVQTNSSKSCNDGDKCTMSDACKGGKCGGSPKPCADSSVCTADFCNNLTGLCDIAAAADVTACDDGNGCTVGDKCLEIVCKGGEAKSCDDGSPCTMDNCDPVAGTCTSAPIGEGSACGAGNQCLTNGSCKAGVCTGDLKACDDKNPCTQDLCDPASGVCTQSQLIDGTPCVTGKTCQAGVCL
ncbi:MAG: hypothetical protein EXR77_06065 [Myxococcales bacterium]|nr:hypothetical protein [Myxococcales bacterium]